MQHHGEILAGRTMLDAPTHSYIQKSFGITVCEGRKDQITYEGLQNFVLDALLESHET